MEKRTWIEIGVAGIFIFLLVFMAVRGNRVPTLKNGQEVVASIDGKQFTAEDLYAELIDGHGFDALMRMIDIHIARLEVEVTAELEKEVWDIIEFYRTFAESNGMDLFDFLAVQGVHLNSEQELFDLLIDDFLIGTAIERQIARSLSDNEITAFYEENFSEVIRARHILITVPAGDDGNKEREEAVALINQLNNAEGDVEELFAKLAREHSGCGSASNGGMLSDVTSRSMIAPFWEASRALKNKSYSATPVRTDNGWHIIYRISSSPRPNLADIRDEVVTAMVQELLRTDETLQLRALIELRERYNLRIFDPTIRRQFEAITNSVNQ